jgi:hypothetical protein
MNDLAFYFKEGIFHILSLDALDHLLFLLALVSIFQWKEWKNILLLVTAFTIGHACTLFLSAYKLIHINDSLVEILIPCTIVITAFLNTINQSQNEKKIKIQYFLALFFGLIHGLGFANTIRFMLAKDQSMAWSLFGFNIGVEVGQISVVFIILLINYFWIAVLKLPYKFWVYLLNFSAIVLGLKIILERVLS